MKRRTFIKSTTAGAFALLSTTLPALSATQSNTLKEMFRRPPLGPSPYLAAVANAPAGGGGNAANAIREIPKWFVEGKPKPPGSRIAFTTWRHWRKDSPLLASGLLGAVRLRFAVKRGIVAGRSEA